MAEGRARVPSFAPMEAAAAMVAELARWDAVGARWTAPRPAAECTYKSWLAAAFVLGPLASRPHSVPARGVVWPIAIRAQPARRFDLPIVARAH